MIRRWVALAAAFFLIALALPAGAGAQESGGASPAFVGPVRGSFAWEPCPVPLGPPDSGAPEAPLECATLDVPIDYDVDDGPTVPIALWRYPALAGPNNTRGHLLLNPGGPGGPVLDMLLGVGDTGVFAEYDLIGMDPRGVGLSRSMACEALFDADKAAGTDYGNLDDFEAVTETLRSIIPTCDADLVSHLGTVNVAHDMDRLRQGLRVDQLNFFGASYGTHLGAVYAELYPDQVGRFILDGPVLLGDLQTAIGGQIAGFEDSLNRFDAGCAAGANCALQPYGARSVWRHLKWRYKNAPVTATVEGPNGPEQVVVDFDTFMNAANFAFNVGRDIWDFYAQALLQASQGDAALLWDFGQFATQSPFFESARTAVVCSDDETRISAAESQQLAYQQILAGNESFALEIGSRASRCEAVPFAEPTPTIDIAAGDTAPILIVAKTHDPATPYDGALRFAEAVRSGTLLTVVDDGHTAVARDQTCVDSIAANYLVTGELPAAGTVCQPDRGVIGFDPAQTGPGENGGLIVSALYPGFPADGVLLVGDEVLLIGGQNPFEGPPPIVVGVPLELELIRDGEPLTVTIVPATPAFWLPDQYSPTGDNDDAPAVGESDDAVGGDETPLANAVGTLGGGPLAAGDYETDALGTELSLTIGSDWESPFVEPAAFLLAKDESAKKGPFSEALIVVRVDAFPVGGEADVEPPSFTGAADDVNRWLAGGEFIVENRSTVTVGGQQALTFDLRVDPTGTRTLPGGCGPTPNDRCFFVAQTRSQALNHFIVRTTESYRFWLIDQGSEDPILVLAIAAEGNEAFLDESAAIVDSFELGAPAPQPVEKITGPLWEAGKPSVIPAGDVTVPALGGLTFTLDNDRFVFQEQNHLRIGRSGEFQESTEPNMVVALAQLQDDNLAVIADRAALVELIDLHLTITPTGESIEALGVTLSGYTVVGDVQGQVFPGIGSAPLGGASNIGWLPGNNSLLYIGDAPEGGAYVVGMDASTAADLPAAKAIFDAILPTLALVE